MKKYIFLLSISCGCLLTNLMAQSLPKPVIVSAVGYGKHTPSLEDFNVSIWLNADTNETIRPILKEIGSDREKWRLQIVFNLSQFPSWKPGDLLNVEVEWNDGGILRKSNPWKFPCLTTTDWGIGWFRKPEKSITFPDIPTASEIQVEDLTLCEGETAYFEVKVSDAWTAAYTIRWTDEQYREENRLDAVGLHQVKAGGFTPEESPCVLHAILMNGSCAVDTAEFVLNVRKKQSEPVLTMKRHNGEVRFGIQQPLNRAVDYTWLVDGKEMAGETEPVFLAEGLKGGEEVVCRISGEALCPSSLLSNVLVYPKPAFFRDTTVEVRNTEEEYRIDLGIAGDENCSFELQEAYYPCSVALSEDGILTCRFEEALGMQADIRYCLRSKPERTIVAEGTVHLKRNPVFTLEIPNVITPNGDGLNDYWRLDFLQDYPEHRVILVNRLGEVVFTTRNYRNNWDGRIDGIVAYGIYTYRIELGNGRIISSWLEVRR